MLYDFSSTPKGAWLTVNRACNFRCKWCYAKDTEYSPEADMSLEMALRLADIINDFGIKNINLIGGEPTMWPHLTEFNDYCRGLNISTTIITNAFLFGNDKYWENYSIHPCDCAVVSIKGINAVQLNEIAGVNNVDQTLRGIERAVKCHSRARIESVCSTMTNSEDILAIAEYAKSVGSESILINACNVTLKDGGATDEYVLDADIHMGTMIDVYHTLNEMFEGKMGYEITLPLCMWPKDFILQLIDRGQLVGPCNVHDRSGIVFDCNGDVLFCNTIYDTVLVRSSDYCTAGSLLEILNSDAMKEQYSEVLRLPSDECSVCSLADLCRGGCIANWMIIDPAVCKAY